MLKKPNRKKFVRNSTGGVHLKHFNNVKFKLTLMGRFKKSMSNHQAYDIPFECFMTNILHSNCQLSSKASPSLNLSPKGLKQA